MIQRISISFAPLVAACLFGCQLLTNPGDDPASEDNGDTAEANSDTAGGSGGTAGGSRGTASGSGATSGGNGQVSATETPGASDCSKAERLPEKIVQDLTVGPGCVRVHRTEVASGASLTLLPGTTVQMEAAGYLDVSPQSDVGSHLIAIGTPERPILFTSASEDPLPGDWQCVRIGVNGSNSQLEHAIFEYGGQACRATSAEHDTTLDIEAPLRALRNVTVRDSLNKGILLESRAAVRDFSSNHFARNGGPSIQVDAAQILQLGAGNSFEDADDYIDVPEGGIDSSGTWRSQGVPFRVQNVGIRPGFDVTVAAGVRIEMSGGTIDANNANFNIEGTAAEPVVFTSAQKNPRAGDWGCLLYSYSSVTPHIDHAIFEYAGSGSGCLGSSTKAAVIAPNSAAITNTVFRNIDGVGISTRGDCNVADWCQNEFIEVALGPFECEGTRTPCPGGM